MTIPTILFAFLLLLKVQFCWYLMFFCFPCRTNPQLEQVIPAVLSSYRASLQVGQYSFSILLRVRGFVVLGRWFRSKMIYPHTILVLVDHQVTLSTFTVPVLLARLPLIWNTHVHSIQCKSTVFPWRSSEIFVVIGWKFLTDTYIQGACKIFRLKFSAFGKTFRKPWGYNLLSHTMHVVHMVWYCCEGIVELQPACRCSWSCMGSEWYWWWWSSWPRWVHCGMLLCSTVVATNVRIFFTEIWLMVCRYDFFSYWHCPHSMQSRIYVMVWCLFICLSVCLSHLPATAALWQVCYCGADR